MKGMVVAIAVAVSSLAAAPQKPAPFSATANLVIVPAIVTGGRGELLTGLAAADFTVLEDGRPVPIQAFLPPDAEGAGADGRVVVLALDNIRTRPEIGTRVQDIAYQFADRMGPGDVVSVITVDAGRASGTSQASVRQAIQRFRPAFGDTIRSAAEEAESGLQAISSMAAPLADLPRRRKVIVYIGAASLFSPQEPSAFDDRGTNLSQRWVDAVRATARHNVSIYVIDPAGFSGRSDDYADSFAAQTGGVAWANASNLKRAVDQVWRESLGYYLIGYQAPVDDRRLHRIEVRVSQPGVTVRARKGRG